MRTFHANNHRGAIAAVVIGVLALSGAICIGVALADQQPALVQPPRSAPAPLAAAPTGAALPSPVPAAPPAVPEVSGPVLPESAPRSLAIPAIGVRSPLLYLGLDAKGAMETPQPGRDYNKAGWYRHSPSPGALGPAVIAGHVDSAKEGPSVFYRLGSLRRGNEVMVTRADGSVAVFAVTEVRRYPKSRFPSQLVYGNTDHAALRLITCGGPFDRDARNYLDNIVVYATMIRALNVPKPPTPSASARPRIGGV